MKFLKRSPTKVSKQVLDHCRQAVQRSWPHAGDVYVDAIYIEDQRRNRKGFWQKNSKVQFGSEGLIEEERW